MPIMKTHVNLSVADLGESVAFYRTLLNSEPEKYLDDYALFITEDPGLELALDRDALVKASNDMHFGLVVDSADAVENVAGRLRSAGLKTLVEREKTCCYANQTKVWVSDPDGRRWEVYTVHEETAERDSDASCCAAG